jgi:hypothetical protein
MLIRLAIGAHDTKVMLGMLEQIFGSDSVAARRRLTRQCYIPLENLIGVSANFDVWAVAFENLNSVRHPLSVMVRITSIIAAARSLVWAWSHGAYLILVDTLGALSDWSVPHPLSDLGRDGFA